MGTLPLRRLLGDGQSEERLSGRRGLKRREMKQLVWDCEEGGEED